MKATSTLKGALLLCILFFSLISCKKDTDNIDVSGNTNVMVVNAAEGTSGQILLLDNVAVNGDNPVIYTQNSEYYSIKAGEERKAEFRSAGTATLNTAFDVSLETNKYYSIYLTGNNSNISFFKTEDDLSLPITGKAKVRFVHLSSAASQSVDVGLSNGAKVINNLKYKSASSYIEVDAGSSFQLYTAGSSSASMNIPITVQTGRVFNFYITGSTLATIEVKAVKQK